MKVEWLVAVEELGFNSWEELTSHFREVKKGNFYSKPCNWREGCGYSISDTIISYTSCRGNMAYLRDEKGTLYIGYQGRRHGIRGPLESVAPYLISTLVALSPRVYKTEEPSWEWYHTLDDHPENENHYSWAPHWGEYYSTDRLPLRETTRRSKEAYLER